MSKTQKLLPLIEAEMRQPEMKERLQLQWIWSAAPQLKKQYIVIKQKLELKNYCIQYFLYLINITINRKNIAKFRIIHFRLVSDFNWGFVSKDSFDFLIFAHPHLA